MAEITSGSAPLRDGEGDHPRGALMMSLQAIQDRICLSEGPAACKPSTLTARAQSQPRHGTWQVEASPVGQAVPPVDSARWGIFAMNAITLLLSHSEQCCHTLDSVLQAATQCHWWHHGLCWR